MQWHFKTFNELSNIELYQILQLRVDVFVVEQDCPYSDLDGKDTLEGAFHFFATQPNEEEKTDRVVAYMRILAPNISYPNMSSLGRVATHESVRGSGIGHIMLEKAAILLDKKWPDKTCHISAQSHLQKYYNRQDFQAVGKEYLEDNIPHIGMERAPF